MKGVRAAVVTGAGRGIGKSTALALAREGLAVALWSRSRSEVESVKREIEALGNANGDVLGLVVDVASAASVAVAAHATLKAFGAPLVVVNNAGIVTRSAITKTSEASWNAVVATNMTGPFLVTKALLPAMLRAKRGRIVHVASISSTLGTAMQASYCASKWGLVGFMKSLAEELRGTGLQTMAVLPGAVDTDMLKGSPFAPQMQADDVARAIVHAALYAADAMNGSAIEMFGP
jgi:3-oxoacyl-[acyl-carrier protein] reductase